MNPLQTTKPEDRFYIYRHLRNDTGQPFYIGRGVHHPEAGSYPVQYGRAYSKRGRTEHWKRVVEKCGYTIEILVDHLTITEAKVSEEYFIKLYGKATKGGLLVNFHDGGNDGSYGRAPTEEQRKVMSEKRTITIDSYIDTCVEYEAMTGCWLWTGPFSEKYPKLGGRNLNAVRSIYQHVNKVELKFKKEALHNTCGQLHCVNPLHYRIDHNCPKGSQARKLSEEQAKEIIHLLETTVEGPTSIAKRFNVRSSTVEAIKNCKSWKWLKRGEVMERIPPNQKKKILCLTNNELYESSIDASLKLFGDKSPARSIRHVCTNQRPYYKGFTFRYV